MAMSEAIASMDEYIDGVTELEYCERCGQVFATFDLFYDHRENSDEPGAKEWNEDDRFVGRRTLEPGDEFPDGAIVGQLEPCEAVE